MNIAEAAYELYPNDRQGRAAFVRGIYYERRNSDTGKRQAEQIRKLEQVIRAWNARFWFAHSNGALGPSDADRILFEALLGEPFMPPPFDPEVKSVVQYKPS